jgi:hypothetical protein
MLPDYSKLIASPRLQVQPALLNELKGYLAVGPIPVIDWNDQDTIRRGQEILAEMEAKLDRVMAIHHDAKRILQRISSVITTVKAELVNTQVLTAKMYELLRRWELVAELCHDAQKRLDTAKDTIKLMAKLDDNLRWASNRNP